MKIEYRSPATTGGGGYTVLADDASFTLGDSISQFQPTLTRQAQKNGLAMSAKGFVRDAGNSNWRVSFSVERVHLSVDAALEFLVTQGLIFKTVPGAGFDLKITVGAQVVYVPGCAVEEFTPAAHSDRSTSCRYVFAAGDYTDAPP